MKSFFKMLLRIAWVAVFCLVAGVYHGCDQTRKSFYTFWHSDQGFWEYCDPSQRIDRFRDDNWKKFADQSPLGWGYRLGCYFKLDYWDGVK